MAKNGNSGRLLNGNPGGDPSKAPRCEDEEGHSVQCPRRCAAPRRGTPRAVGCTVAPLRVRALPPDWSAVDGHDGKMATDQQPLLPNASTAQRKHDKLRRNSGTSKCCGAFTADCGRRILIHDRQRRRVDVDLRPPASARPGGVHQLVGDQVPSRVEARQPVAPAQTFCLVLSAQYGESFGISCHRGSLRP
jgi:hypothetical protein